jgi:hypothetical protein
MTNLDTYTAIVDGGCSSSHLEDIIILVHESPFHYPSTLSLKNLHIPE